VNPNWCNGSLGGL